MQMVAVAYIKVIRIIFSACYIIESLFFGCFNLKKAKVREGQYQFALKCIKPGSL